MSYIKTNNYKYELYSLYNGRANTSIYSYDNKCLSCQTVCEVGLVYKELINQDVEA